MYDKKENTSERIKKENKTKTNGSPAGADGQPGKKETWLTHSPANYKKGVAVFELRRKRKAGQ